ncbi:thioesterase family protein [Amaricoccus sp.]|uniref:acyl-CoA thioesterase n=1 Tax=Amaricoccus sp. TaxID=1872485 RepID=UPI001B79DAF3|nr:thioesterase family protein [Amaricoccus sp.]MBP7242018.1 acyl-CoA thioesterase [Amaricoccus sp.]
MRPAPPDRADFPHFDVYPIRWRDNDVYGHMNNAVYYEYADSVVARWLTGPGGLAVPDGPVICLVVETGCTYFGSLGFPDTVEAGLRLDRVGGSSITYEIGLFAAGAPTAAARVRFVHVCVDSVTRRPAPVPPGLRAALAALGPHVQSGA